MNSKIYKTIFCKEKGQWIVVSELTKGKSKTKNKKIKSILPSLSIFIGSLSVFSPLALAAQPYCDINNVCYLDSAWSYSMANNGASALFVNDGNTYTVYSPGSMNTNVTFPTRTDVNIIDVWNNGWVTSSTYLYDPGLLNQLIFSNEGIENVQVTNDGNLTETVRLYNANNINVTQSGTQSIITIVDPSVTSAQFYYDAGFVNVTNGEAIVRLDAALDTITTGLSRNTVFALADGTGSTAAKVIWDSSVNYEVTTLKDDFSSSSTSGTQTVTAHEYKGTFTAHDGSTWSVTNFAEYQTYLNWVNEEVKNGTLNSQIKYDAARTAAYNINTYTFDYTIPGSTGPAELYNPKTGDALIMGKGANATIEIAEGVVITQKTGPSSSGGSADIPNNPDLPYGIVLVTEGATGHNYGTLQAHGGYSIVSSQGAGSTFINENSGVIEIGCDSLTESCGRNRTQTMSARDGGEIINKGTLIHHGSSTATTDMSGVFHIYNEGKFTNQGEMSFSVSDKAWSSGDYHYARLFNLSGDNSQFINDTNGIINLGIDLNGGATGVGANSFIVRLDTNNSQATQSENRGTINVGGRVKGSNIITSTSTPLNYFVNYGTINLDGNRDANGDAAVDALSNVAMNRSHSATANPIDFINAGIINVDGYGNIALKATTRGKILSTGTINVNGNQTSSGLNNYGAWVEGSGSLIEIAGDINLTGNDSIGIYATDQGTVNLTGSGQVNFNSGENQIGYYIYGAGSKIVNTSTGTQDVSTNNSTLMRLDGGASFTGSNAATSTMTASGDNAKVIVATGSNTTVNSGGMTANVTGNDAIGFLIEGGATGTIDSNTHINLLGIGAIAGIADGQGHNLDGSVRATTNTQKLATILTANATLTSSLDNVIGYIARNLATINNSGNITFTGKDAIGIQVEEGAKGINNGNIILGEGGIGLFATADTDLTQLTNTGNLTLNGDNAIGIVANGAQVIVNMLTSGFNTPTITLNGTGAVGVKASAGSTVNLDSSVVTLFSSSATDQIGFWLSGKADDGTSSKINIAASTTPYNVSGERSTLFYVDDSASLNGVVNATISGKDASGIRVSDSGSNAVVDAGSQITISGNGATGVLAQQGGTANIAAGALFTLNGINATVGIVEHVGSKITNGASVSSMASSSGATAFIARNGGELVNTGNIDLSAGSNHIAINVFDGIVSNTGSIKANGTAIYIQGENAVINNSGSIEAVDGRAAIELGDGASLNLAAITGTGTITAKGTADGILLSAGAQGLNVSNTTIDMSDSTSTGVGIHNKAGISGIKLDNTTIKVNNGVGIYSGASLDANNSGVIDVNGGIGILYQNTDGTATSNNLDLSDSNNLTINVNAANGQGIVANLTGANKEVNSAVNVNINHVNGGAALDVTGATKLTQQGNLISQNGNVVKAGDATVIENSGKIHAGNRTLNAIVMNYGLDKQFTNTGSIIGLLNFGGGKNTVTLKNDSVNDGDIFLGSDDDNQITLSDNAKLINGSGITALGKNTLLTMLDNASIAGSVSLGDGQNNVSLADNAFIAGILILGQGNNTITLANNSAVQGDLISGSGNNTITLSDDSLANTITVGMGNNQLTIEDNAHITSFTAVNGGENTVLIKDNATFGTLDAGTGGANDTLTFDNASYTLTNAADIQHFDLLNLTNGSTFTTNQLLQMGDTATSTGRIAIDTNSALVLNPTATYTLNHALLGNGLIDVQSGTTFDFGTASGNQFAGTVQMNSDSFLLSGQNTYALTHATLTLMSGNKTTVGAGTQTIGGLTFNGGTAYFNVGLPSAPSSNAFINITGKLNATGSGNVQINKGSVDNSVAPIINQSLGLLDQQNETLVQLASAASVDGGAGNLTLIDENNNVISNGTLVDVDQGGLTVAEATYDYRLTTGNNNDGLYVGYGLTQLNLLGTGVNKLLINTSYSNEKQLSAKLTGTGDLGVAAGNGSDALTISNSDNDYTGETDLQTGTLILGSDNALGQTSKLSLANSTTADLNGKNQTIVSLNGLTGSTLNVNNGHLTISNGGTSSGALTGSGNLTLAGGSLTINNANSDFSALTTINAFAEALLKDVLALGSANVVADGDLTLDNATGTFANNVSGSGQINSHNGSNIILSGNNNAFNGIIDIDSASTITISENQHIGAATTIQNANQFIVDNVLDMALAAIVSGSGDVIKTNSGTLTLNGTNVYSGGTIIKNGIVAISSDDNLGDGSTTNVTLLDGGNLQITADLTSGRDVTLAQSGGIIVDNNVTATMNGWNDRGISGNAITKAGQGTLIWTGDNSGNTADVNISGGKLQIENLSNLASANGKVYLDAAGTLAIVKNALTAADVNFTRQLAGNGAVSVDLGDNDKTFSFNSSASGNDFAGTVIMDSGRFSLDANADNVMANATLQLNGNGVSMGSTKLSGNHTIGGLTFNGGRLEVDYSSIDNRPTGHLTVNHLDASGGGSLAITTPSNLPNPMPVTGSSLFDQDDNIYDQIVSADTVNGSGSQLQLVQSDGTPIGLDTVIGLDQGGVTAGNAHYNYFTAVRDDGLYLAYGLTELEAFAGQSIILDNSNATDNSLGAKLSGLGGFTINANGTVRIGNATSNYSGATDINTGNVVMITDNAFGNTSALNLAAGTGVDMNGNSQTIGELNGTLGSLFNFNGGELTITNGGQADGTLYGAGKLILAGGILNITGNNSGFTGTTQIDSGATAHLTDILGLGTNAISNEGTLELDSLNGIFVNDLSGSNGDVLLSNNADILLFGDNSAYAGSFTITSGSTLSATRSTQLGSADVNVDGDLVLETTGLWQLDNQVSGSGSLIKKGTGIVQITGTNVAVGLTDIEDGIILLGDQTLNPLNSSLANLVSDVTIRENGTLGGYGTVTGDVTNKGNIILGDALTAAGHGLFIIDGNYIGDDGTIIFSTVLDDDLSSTDKLIINGDTSGQSKVIVINALGAGEQTDEGIKIIEVGGNSAGQFQLSGRAIAGAYEYFLYQGGVTTPNDGDWYLRSQLYSTTIYRPEGGGYMANMSAAGKLFNLRLNDREGRAENSSMWLRQVGSRNKFRDGSGQLRTAINTYVVQGGGEVWDTKSGDTGRFGLGIMAAYGHAQGEVRSTETNYIAKNEVNGYSVGIYGTWYQNALTLDGGYVDSWLQYSWLDAEVNGESLAGESYNMDGFSASLEAGYRKHLYSSIDGEVYFTPQAQVIWNGIDADKHREANGTEVKSLGRNNINTRLGFRLSLDGVHDQDIDKDKLFTVYAEANWLYNSKMAGASMDGISVKQAGSRNVGELKVGFEGQLNKNLNVWTNVAQQLGDKGYSDTAVTLGVKYRF